VRGIKVRKRWIPAYSNNILKNVNNIGSVSVGI